MLLVQPPPPIHTHLSSNQHKLVWCGVDKGIIISICDLSDNDKDAGLPIDIDINGRQEPSASPSQMSLGGSVSWALQNTYYCLQDIAGFAQSLSTIEELHYRGWYRSIGLQHRPENLRNMLNGSNEPWRTKKKLPSQVLWKLRCGTIAWSVSVTLMSHFFWQETKVVLDEK